MQVITIRDIKIIKTVIILISNMINKIIVIRRKIMIKARKDILL